MRLINWYPNKEDNIGIIEKIITDGLDIEDHMVSCSKIGSMSIGCCMGFKPEVGMKVELMIDDDDEVQGWILVQV